MYEIIDNKVYWNGDLIETFKYPIAQSIPYENDIIVRIDIPVSSSEADNIYRVNKGGIAWRSEEIALKYPNKPVFAYELMRLENGTIVGVDFIEIQYYIDIETGKILDRKSLR